MSFNLSRRSLMQGTAAAGVLAASGAPAIAAPKRGGSLRLGLKGANTSDTWDGRTHSDSYMINMGHGCVFDCLTKVKSNGDLTGELAESWTSPDAKVFTSPSFITHDLSTFKLRKALSSTTAKISELQDDD